VAIQKGGGLVTAADLAAYEVKEREPIRAPIADTTSSVLRASSGGVALIEILNILEGFDLAKLGNRSAAAIHLEAEAFRRAFTIAPIFWAIPTSPNSSGTVDRQESRRHGATPSTPIAPA